jgi:tetratricopeptide (TPR) repeat protein
MSRNSRWPMISSGRGLPGLLLLVLAVAGGFALSAAHAQGGPTDAALQAAFRDSVARPTDANLALRYAQLAAARGQTRAAIAALERALRYNPRLNSLRLELASLYAAAGSPDIAAVYAREALASPDIPPDVAVRARQLLAGAERGSARSLFVGNLFAGARYDSNANQATTLGSVSAFSPFFGIVPVTPSIRGQSDASLVLTGQVAHRYDLGLQREGTWETNLSAFRQDFAQVPHAYDLTVAQLDTGPRIGVAEFGDAILALRPFLAASYLAYGDHSLAWLYGGGVAAELRLPPRWDVEVAAQGRQGSYYNSDFRPTVGLYTGPEYTISVTASYAINNASRVSATAFYYDASAQAAFYSRNGPGGSVTASTEFALAGRVIGASARVGIRQLNYGGADPLINPFRKRDDTVFDTGLSLVVPLVQNLSVVAEYDYVRQWSAYDVFSFDDHAVTLGLRLGF